MPFLLLKRGYNVRVFVTDVEVVMLPLLVSSICGFYEYVVRQSRKLEERASIPRFVSAPYGARLWRRW